MPKPFRKSLLSLLIPRLGRATPEKLRSPAAPRFQSVSIHRGANYCAMAKQLGDRRFLARGAPALPLSGCNVQGQCHCRYVKHHDRRTEPRRLMDVGMRTLVFDGRELRSRTGRRSTD